MTDNTARGWIAGLLSLKADLRLWLKQHPQLKNDKRKRSLLYENLPGLALRHS
jgi:hypothetical protein